MKDKGKVFLLDDEELIVSMLSKLLRKEGYNVQSETTTHNIVNKIRSWSPDVLLLDIKLPDQSGIEILQELKEKGINTQVVMLTADDAIETAIKAMKLGAADYITKPFNSDELKIVINNIIEKEKLKQELSQLRKTCSEFVEKDIVGESHAIKELMSKIKKIVHARVPTILITGESGVGKEIVARHIHYLMYGDADIRYAPFISINCAAMPEALLESELFGYQRGAFTDAKSDKKGLFEVADGGTLLLDEIGDMKPNLQSKLLRVLEDRTVRRIGGKEEIPIDITVIATTNRNIPDTMKKGEFRQDLFFRLTAFYLHIVPLRERIEDIPLLARHFLSYFVTKYNKQTIKGFSPESDKLMVSYNWPGNIRELKNLVERIVVLENTEIIQPEHLPQWLTDHLTVKQSLDDNRFILPESGISLEGVEKDLLTQALEKTGHNKSRAAKLLNISYDTLRYQIKKFGLE